VAIDNQDRVFVVDTTGGGASVFRTLVEGQARPEYLGFFGGPGVADGEFQYPIGAAVDDRGRVYVADTANNRVQVWSY
jgi:DNA-binding beta-propeller fold protein YncE